MKIVIIGLGTIGHTILKSIDRVSHTITVIDENKEKIESVIEHYDVFGVVGNGASREIQQEAGVSSADLVIVLTKSDELNIYACLVAKNIGAKNTIARVRNPEYRGQIMDMQDSLGISMIVNPEMDTAREIFHLINLPSIAQIERFAKGRALLVEIDSMSVRLISLLRSFEINSSLANLMLVISILSERLIRRPPDRRIACQLSNGSLISR